MRFVTGAFQVKSNTRTTLAQEDAKYNKMHANVVYETLKVRIPEVHPKTYRSKF